MSETTHNLDRCLAQLKTATDAYERDTLAAIRKKSIKILRYMVFGRGLPVYSGLTAGMTRLGVNSVSTYKISRTMRRIKEALKTKNAAGRQAAIALAHGELQGAKTLAGLHLISIANNSPIMGGAGRREMLPAMIGAFEEAAQLARAEFSTLAAEVTVTS